MAPLLLQRPAHRLLERPPKLVGTDDPARPEICAGLPPATLLDTGHRDLQRGSGWYEDRGVQDAVLLGPPEVLPLRGGELGHPPCSLPPVHAPALPGRLPEP